MYEGPQQFELKYYYRQEVISKNYEGKYFVKDTYTFINTATADTNYIIDTIYIRITNEGLLFSPPEGMEVYLLKQPFEAGNIWSYEINDSLSYNFEITDNSFSIETPAGNFAGCLKVKTWISDESLPPQEIIFAPDVGIVKTGSYELVLYQIP